MYEVAQGMYNTYLDLENGGDVENAAMVKKQLESTLAAMQGYTTSFIQQRQSLNDDKVLAVTITITDSSRGSQTNIKAKDTIM